MILPSIGSTSEHHSHEHDKHFIKHIQWVHKQGHEAMEKDQKKYKDASDRHRVDHTFQIGDRVWIYLSKERFKEKERKIKPLRYGPYLITEQFGDNNFFLDLPPYMGLHPLFNVDKVKLFEPPLFDELEESPWHPDAIILDFDSPYRRGQDL